MCRDVYRILEGGERFFKQLYVKIDVGFSGSKGLSGSLLYLVLLVIFTWFSDVNLA